MITVHHLIQYWLSIQSFSLFEVLFIITFMIIHAIMSRQVRLVAIPSDFIGAALLMKSLASFCK